MPSRKRRYSEITSTFGPKNFGAAVRQHLKEQRLVIRAKERQDFPWFVECLLSWLDGDVVSDSLDVLSVRAENTLRYMARNTLQTLYDLWRQEGYITKPHCIGSLSEELIHGEEAREHFLFALREQCLVYLYQTLASDPFYIPPVTKPDERHRPNRKRIELPDPEQPAWASVNRRKSTKFQITCRLEWHVKARIQAAAHMMGQSQAAWIEAAIKNALLDHRYVLPLKHRDDHARDEPSSGRRGPRQELPETDVSRHASVNRADKSTTVRMCKSLAERIDGYRESQSRSQWINEAVRMFVVSGEELPTERVAPSGPLVQVVGLRFDREFFAELELIMAKSGRSKSDWFRSIALWRMETLANPPR